MPATVPGIMSVLIPNLVSTGMIGTDGPKYARGVAVGLSIWVSLVKVTTIDAGSAGSGTNVPLPILIPSPVLYANLLQGRASHDLVGIFMPTFMLGLANGLSTSFLQMLVKTTHVGVGTGSGVAKFSAPPAFTSIIQGFSAAGMSGPAVSKKAAALGQALDTTIASLVLPVVVVGSASPVAATGTGFGGII